MEKRAVLGFSYGYRKDGPGLSNRALIRKFYEKCSNERTPLGLDLILQSELSDAHDKEGLNEYDRFCGLKIVHVIDQHRVAGEYLDTDEVVYQGVEFAAKAGYEEITVMAKPIPHLVLCYFLTRKLAKPYGIKVKIAWVGFIPNDPLSEQSFARNIIGPYLYTIRRVILGQKGN